MWLSGGAVTFRLRVSWQSRVRLVVRSGKVIGLSVDMFQHTSILAARDSVRERRVPRRFIHATVHMQKRTIVPKRWYARYLNDIA